MRVGRVEVFDDPYSLVHVAVSMFLALLAPTIWLGATMLFIAYNWFEREKWSEKRGDFVEWVAGAIIAVLAKAIVFYAQRLQLMC